MNAERSIRRKNLVNVALAAGLLTAACGTEGTPRSSIGSETGRNTPSPLSITEQPQPVITVTRTVDAIPSPRPESKITSPDSVTGEHYTCPGDFTSIKVGPQYKDEEFVVLKAEEGHPIVAMNNTDEALKAGEGTGVTWRLPSQDAQWHPSNPEENLNLQTVVIFKDTTVQVDLGDSGGMFICENNDLAADAEGRSRMNDLNNNPLLQTRMVREELVEGKEFYYTRDVAHGTDAYRLPLIKNDPATVKKAA